MDNLLNEKHFLTLLFENDTSKEAYDFFNQYPEFIGKITLTDCIELLYKKELYFNNNWQQLDKFIKPSQHKYKKILRDLLDFGYIESCPEGISADYVYKIAFLLVELGMYCIASEFFASACSSVPQMQEIWDSLKGETSPNLRAYITKFANKEINLEFMKGLLHE